VSAGGANLAVVLVTADHFASLRRTVRYLREQTIRDQIELVLVGPRADSFADLEPHEADGFAGWRTLAVGPIDEVERALGAGVARTTAPVVALLENHVYPDPDWASAILDAHRGPWAAVGSEIRNANPKTAASWVEHFLTYGFHDQSMPGGEVKRVPRNNTTYKRSVLMEFGDRLPDLLARDGGFLEELRAHGYRFYRESRSRMQHLNPSRVYPVLALRLLSSRASAATRARTERWSTARRLAYVASSPLFPILRLRALWPQLRVHPERRVLPSIAPLLAVALVLDAIGQAIGFAFGAGDSAARAGIYDLDRQPFLCDAERTGFAS
jgi:hypothetical protein